jgi:1-acyl-sn-glycerol-3-phosphate acyltransferase
LLYNILREIAATLFKIYFRKIYLIDAEKLPLTGPVLLSSNHPMAFAEACLLACFLNRPLYFLVRGDVFKKGWQWFFKGTNQIPIYRFRDGFSNMRRNKESFSRAHEALSEEKAILIFSEGNTRMQKKLAPLQKGLARLAFGAYAEKNVQDIQVVPVGVNYSNGKLFRSDVTIKIGDPLFLNDYIDRNDEDNQEAAKSLTQDLFEAMLPQIIHIENREDERLADRLFEIYGNLANETPWPILDYARTRFEREKEIADQINHLSEDDKKDLLRLTAHPYELVRRKRWKIYLILLIAMPLALGGLLLNAIPFYISKSIADRKVTQVEFYTPVRMGLMIVLYITWFILCLFILLWLLGWYALIAIWILPLSGFVTILWKEGLDDARRSKLVNPSIFRQIEQILKS